MYSMSVTKAVELCQIWILTCEFTVARNLSNVLNVMKALELWQTWMLTYEFTVAWNPSIVLNVTDVLVAQAIWNVTWWHTVVRNPWNVLNVTKALELWGIWIITWEFSGEESFKCTRCNKGSSFMGSLLHHKWSQCSKSCKDGSGLMRRGG